MDTTEIKKEVVKEVKVRHYTGEYGRLPADDSEAGTPMSPKPLANTYVTYNSEKVKVIKPMKKWLIIEHDGGQMRYVKLGHVSQYIEPTTQETQIEELEKELVEA